MTKLAKLPLAATILCAMGLTACGEVRTRLPVPPAELAECADEPEVPELPARPDAPPMTDESWQSGAILDWLTLSTQVQRKRDELTLTYILGWRSVWGDCKADVAGVKAWRETVAH